MVHFQRIWCSMFCYISYYCFNQENDILSALLKKSLCYSEMIKSCIQFSHVFHGRKIVTSHQQVLTCTTIAYPKSKIGDLSMCNFVFVLAFVAKFAGERPVCRFCMTHQNVMPKIGSSLEALSAFRTKKVGQSCVIFQPMPRH